MVSHFSRARNEQIYSELGNSAPSERRFLLIQVAKKKIGATIVLDLLDGRYKMPRVLKLICVSAVAVYLIGCAHASNPLVGSWRLVSSGDEVIAADDDAKTTVKILNDTHFAFGIMTPENEVFGGGGRYEYSNGIFTEIVEYHSLPYLVGQRIAFRCELKGDLWYHSGSFGSGGGSIDVNEVWKRIEKRGF